MSDRLRVLSVCRSFPSPGDPSSGIFVLNRVAAMARRAELHALQPVPWFPWIRPLPDWARTARREQSGLAIESVPMFYLPGVLKTLDAYWLARVLRGPARRLHQSGRLDAIDAHFGYPEGVACVQVARELGIPAFITVRGFENEYLQKPELRGPMVEAMRAAAGCVCVSHSLKDLVVAHGVPEDRVRVIHNAIDRDVFRPGDRAAARRSLGIGDEVPLVVSVGHLVSRKRHHVLIEALGRVRRKFPTAQLVIVGAESFEPQYPAQLRSMARELGDADAVRFVGNVGQVQVVQWLQAASVFALGTAREGCCNAVLEALAVGAPVVTTAAGDNAHFVRDGENGCIVPVDDAAALASALDSVLGRGPWPAGPISTGLGIGTWDDVAAQVLEFFAERIGRA